MTSRRSLRRRLSRLEEDAEQLPVAGIITLMNGYQVVDLERGIVSIDGELHQTVGIDEHPRIKL